jgi:hypothetical protein
MNSRNSHQHTLGIDRRALLQVGYSGLIGFGLPTLLAQQSRAAESAPSRSQRDPDFSDRSSQSSRHVRFEA